MKKQTLVKSAAVVFFILIAAPYFAFASNYGINSNVFNPSILAGPLVICTGVASTANSSDGTSWGFPACQNLCQLVAQVANVIYFVIAVVLWIIMPVLVCVGGIMIMLAGSNPEMIGRAKKTITGAIWGVVIVLVAWLVVYTFVTTLNITGVGGFGGSNGQAACSVPSSNSNGGASDFW